MENKENYRVKITDLSSDYIISSFYDDLISTNVISIEDVNNLISGVNFCIETLSSICTNQFCQLCENTYNYYINLTDKAFPRVKYYNGRTKAVSAVFSNSTINDILLSSNNSINLLTYPEDTTYNIVSSINGDTGHINGIERIIINNKPYTWTINNKGKVNLGNYTLIDGEILTTINGESGEIYAPKGFMYNYTPFYCDNNGLVNISSIFNNYLISSYPYFNHLYVNNVNENILTSVINLKYLQENTNPYIIKSKAITGVIDTTDDKILNNINFSIDDKFLSFIYGIQSDGQYKTVTGYNTSGYNFIWDQNHYQSGIPLTFIALGGSGVLKLNSKKNWDDNHPEGEQGALPVNLSCSLNYAPYQIFDQTNGIKLNKGDVLSLSGDNDHFCRDDFGWYTFSFDNSNNEKVDYVCYGNIMSLVNWDTEIKTDWQFYALFSGSNLLKAPQLPITTLTPYCYDSLFQDCHNLIVPPILPATTLADNCYRDMFWNCTSLSTVPSLPATGLASGCYFRMFAGCTSLTILPYYLLPATTLAPWCYYAMFWGCENLTDGPLLPAQLPPYNTEGECDPNYVNCYGNIFSNCPNLTAAHLDCDPARLIQHNAPPEIEYIDGQFNEDAGKAWMQNYKNTVGTDAARKWLQEHNYANEWNNNWIEGSSVEGEPATQPHNYPITLYNTMLWQQVRDDSNNNGVEKFYYDYNWQSFNYYWIRKVARSLEDTPFSIEVLQVKEGSGRMCWRSYQKIFTNGDAVIKRHSFTHDIPNTSSYIQEMNPKFKYYTPDGKLSTDWTQCKNMFQHGGDDNGLYLTRLCGKLPFQNSANNAHLKKDAIFSLSSNCFSKGFIEGDQGNGTQQFWQIAFHWGARVKVFGNLKSLVGGRDTIKPYEFYGMFEDELPRSDLSIRTNKILDFHQLILPSNNLNYKSYASMFSHCITSANVKAPLDLPATNLGDKCYDCMFRGCSTLTAAPAIYGSNHKYADCYHMFSGCTNLTIPPSIPNFEYTSSNSFEGMFEGCTSLKYFPDLRVDKIDWRAYTSMFQWCTSLTIPPSLNSKEVSVQGCAHMFYNCNKMVYIPPLPMTTISNNCYTNMFSGCANLKSQYIYLPATALSPSCYYGMLKNTNVNCILVKFTQWNSGTYQWVSNISNIGDFYKRENLSIENGISYIPENWNVYNNEQTNQLYFKEPLQNGDIQIFYLNKK